MTTLRAFVGAAFLLAVIGFVVSVPLVWSLLLGIVEAYPEKVNQVRLYQPKAEPVQKENLLRAAHVQIRDKIEVKQK
jgi:hypothetical protein